MGRIRRHLTFANVASALALFIALGGGTAVALNGSNTVQSDDLGPGAQVKAPDVADNAVNGADVAHDSLRGADINEGTLIGNAKKIAYNAPSSSSSATTTIGKFGPYTLKAGCQISPGGLALSLYANGPAGTADSMWSEVEDDSTDKGDHSNGKPIPASTDTQIVFVGTTSPHYRRIGGRSILRSGSALVQIDFEATADTTSGGNGNCFIYGTATRAI
jgi:hypothetical protein